jgi:hypothetical protein
MDVAGRPVVVDATAVDAVVLSAGTVGATVLAALAVSSVDVSDPLPPSFAQPASRAHAANHRTV